jgi:hypothetical protein
MCTKLKKNDPLNTAKLYSFTKNKK